MKQRSDRTLSSAWLAARLERLARLWSAPRLAQGTRVEISPRLRRSLGLCYPQRALIRLNPILLETANHEMLDETLAHEAAHLVVFWRHGSRARPHGHQWRELMRQAGLPGRATIVHSRVRSLPPVRRSRYLYRHRCLDCGNVFNAGRTDRRWRCAPCHQWGRGGQLKVVRLPIRR